MSDNRPSNQQLTFAEFRKANVTRCVKWHPQGINSWSASDWLTAVTGELGELASLLKMRNRERDGLPGNKFSPTQKQIADELADVLTYLDLLAEALGVDLASAAVEKFNEVSERVGFPDRIRVADEPKAGEWWCDTCEREVQPDHVTYDETHDLRAGGCGQHVFVRAVQPPSLAARDVLAERERQKNVEGWTPEHDDEHGDGSLAKAAASYAAPTLIDNGDEYTDKLPVTWPESWHPTWWKPTTARRNLVKAGALILAEIERLDRASVTKSAWPELDNALRSAETKGTGL